MRLAGVRLPLESYPLQALVSEPIKPIFPCVVMSNTIHAYISQSDKGELVIGAGTDAYTSYTQRGALHVNTHTLDAICELFPQFRRLRMLRNWGGIVDVTPDRSPIIAKTPCRGFTSIAAGARAASRPRRARRMYLPGPSRATSRIPINAPFTIERFRDGYLDRRGRGRGRGALAPCCSFHCPYCGERPEIEFAYGGQAHIARPASPAELDDQAWTEFLYMRSNTKGVSRRALAACARLRAISSMRCAIPPPTIFLPPTRPASRSPIARATPADARRELSHRRHAGASTEPAAAVHRSMAGRMAASPAIRWPRRCSPTACTWSAARSNITARAAFSPRAPKSRTRW